MTLFRSSRGAIWCQLITNVIRREIVGRRSAHFRRYRCGRRRSTCIVNDVWCQIVRLPRRDAAARAGHSSTGTVNARRSPAADATHPAASAAAVIIYWFAIYLTSMRCSTEMAPDVPVPYPPRLGHIRAITGVARQNGTFYAGNATGIRILYTVYWPSTAFCARSLPNTHARTHCWTRWLSGNLVYGLVATGQRQSSVTYTQPSNDTETASHSGVTLMWRIVPCENVTTFLAHSAADWFTVRSIFQHRNAVL